MVDERDGEGDHAGRKRLTIVVTGSLTGFSTTTPRRRRS